MNTFKNNIKSDFTALPNSVATDNSISWKAKGIFLYLASKPQGWDFYMAEIQRNATDGRTALQSGIKELEKSQYLTRKRLYEEGKIVGWAWTLQIPDKTLQTENQPTRKPTRKEPPSYSNKEDSNKEDSNKEREAHSESNEDLGQSPESRMSNGRVDETEPPPEYEIPTKEQVTVYFRDSPILDEDAPLEAEKFINHYEDMDWRKNKGTGKRIDNWHRQAGTWIANYKQWNKDRLSSGNNNPPMQLV